MRIHVEPDEMVIVAEAGENLLTAALRAGIPHAHACNGHARCSTCRIHVDAGRVSPRTAAEQAMADRLGFDDNLRLACQTMAESDLHIRRLVLDERDIGLLDQRGRAGPPAAAGRELELGILFVDIQGFTSFSERLPPHDVVHVLNRFFDAMGTGIERHQGQINNYTGDGFLALFGLDESDSDPAQQAVRAALAMLQSMDALKPYLRSAYDQEFDVRIGVHFGEVVVGSVGAPAQQRITAIGDDVNFASRIEGACKAAETRLLVSEAVHERVAGRFSIGRTVTTPIRGRHGDHRLFEVISESPEARPPPEPE
jgi:adenylate cyclase